MNRIQQEKSFSAFDNIQLHYQNWHKETLNNQDTTPTIIFLHIDSNNEHITHLIETLELSNYCCFSVNIKQCDLSISSLTRSLDEYIRYLKTEYRLQEENTLVIAQNKSATIASTWVHDYAPNIRGLILFSPTFKCKKISGLSFTSKRIVNDASAIYVPTYLLVSRHETIMQKKEQKIFFVNLGTHYKFYHIFKDFNNDYLNEKDQKIILKKVEDIIKGFFLNSYDKPLLLDADKKGVTKNEFDKLSTPETNIFKKIRWKLSRLFLHSVGRYSNGIKIGLDYGFDSGLSLDYLYQNKARGSTPLGKMLDYYYINVRGWKSVRQRKKHVEELLHFAVQKLQERNLPVNILDIAAGPGTYILDFIHKNKKEINNILLRDYDDFNIQKGKDLLKKENITNIAQFEWGDAFSASSLATLPKDRTLTLASGFYELFSDNNMVLRSLQGVADTTQNNGFLIFTTILWNPKLEYTARVLHNHKNKQPWLLRRRHQLEIDQLVSSVGFIKVAQRIDEWGIFSVTLAQKK